MMLTRHNVLILFFCALNVLQVFCVRDNSQHTRGDQCELNNNQRGICKETKDCEHVIKLMKERKIFEVSQCQFEGRIPVVCCPQDTLALTTEPLTTQAPTTKISTPQELSFKPTYPKSKKFLKALCQEHVQITLSDLLIGGESASVGEFPFQAALGYKNLQTNKIEYNCGGSLIADDIVLTAAHCVNRTDTNPITVKLGRASLVPDEFDLCDGEDIDIQSIKLHPKYSRNTRHNDIALIKLKQPTKYSWPIETICLSPDEFSLSKNFTISGFGVNDVDTKKKSDWLLKSTVNLHPFQDCIKLGKLSGKDLAETQFCAIGRKGADSCQGDSGGPVSHTIGGHHYLYGIVSYGMACGGNIPGIYTKVNQFLEWIDDEMYIFEQN